MVLVNEETLMKITVSIPSIVYLNGHVLPPCIFTLPQDIVPQLESNAHEVRDLCEETGQ